MDRVAYSTTDAGHSAGHLASPEGNSLIEGVVEQFAAGLLSAANDGQELVSMQQLCSACVCVPLSQLPQVTWLVAHFFLPLIIPLGHIRQNLAARSTYFSALNAVAYAVVVMQLETDDEPLSPAQVSLF